MYILEVTLTIIAKDKSAGTILVTLTGYTKNSCRQQLTEIISHIKQRGGRVVRTTYRWVMGYDTDESVQ